MGAITTVSAKGQVVIPKDVRERLRLEAGDRLDVIERPDGVLLRRATSKSDESFGEITARIRGRVKYTGPPVPLDDMKEAIGDMWARGGPRWEK